MAKEFLQACARLLWTEEWIPLGPFAPYVLGVVLWSWPKSVDV